MAVNDIGPRIGIQGEKEFHASIKAINDQMRSLGAEMKAVTAEFAANASSEDALAAKNEVLGRSVQAAREKLSVLDGQLARQREKLSALGTELDRVVQAEGETSQAASKAQNAYNRQAAEVARLASQYQTARAQLAGFENALNGVEEAGSGVGQALAAQDVLAGMGAWNVIETGVRTAAASLRDAVQVGMEFNASVSDIAATMGTTVASISNLRGFAEEMGATTVFTASQSAQALNYMALAGYDAEKSMATLPNVLNLAAAGNLELATSSDMVTDAESALGLQSEETARLVDEMALASTKTNTSVGQLGEAILTVGGTAKFLAGGTQELNQVLGILADNSIKGAEGGTKLRNIILSLSSPTKDAAAQLEALGVSVFDAEGNMRRFSEIFPDLQRSLSSLTDQRQIDALSKIFNSRDIAAAQALLGTTAERWGELEAAIGGASGAAERMAETRLDNLAGDLTLLRSAADGARIAFSDSLTPALRGVTQAGTGTLTFVGAFVSEVPMAGEALAGLTAGVATLTVGMTAMSVASQLGVTSIGQLTAAIAASPIGPWAIGIGVAVTAVTALANAADDTVTSTQALNKSLRESEMAYQESSAAILEDTRHVQASISVLEELAAVENKTSAQKESLRMMVEELNESVPGLTLAYDAQTDTLNMTAEAVRQLAEAEAKRQQQAEDLKRMTELYAQQEEIEKKLAEAQEARNSQMQNVSQYIGTYGMSVSALDQSVQDLTEALAANQEEYDALADNLSGVSEASSDAQGSLEPLAVSLEELEEATLYAAGASDTLSEALAEQEKEGSLSLETTNELIEAGYGAALAIDEETGAVTLDRAAYVELAQAKIQEQIAAVEAKKASLAAAAALKVEQDAAYNASSAYWDAAKSKAAMATAGDAQALDLQIAALNRAMNSLNSYSGAASGAARSSGSASKAIKTQAQKDLSAYKTLKAELDHDKAMGLVSEADYYTRLAALRDQYLSDAGNIEEYRKVSESIYKADQKALQEREKLWQTASNDILKLEEEFQKELASRAEEIVNSYKLFDEVPKYQKASGAELISNLENQINSIQSFYDNVDALEAALVEQGASTALADEIRQMGVQASGELAGLLELTDEQLTRYSELYGEKQQLANDIASRELEGLRAQTSNEILGQLDDVAELYDTNGPALGMAFAKALAAGMFEGMPAVESMAQTVASAAMSAFENTYNRDVEAMMTASRGRVSSEDIGGLLSEAVNGMQTAATAAAGSGDLVVQLTVNDRELARATLPAFREEIRANPEVKDDKW